MKKLLFLVFLAGCTGSVDVDSEASDTDNRSTNNQTIRDPNNIGNPDSGNPNSAPDLGDADMGVASQDADDDSPPDMPEPIPDLGDPVYENTCESGPLTEPIQNCRPPLPPSTGDYREDCVRRVNQFRWECQCLPPLQRWTEGEACADQQAAHDAQLNSPHAGFQAGICSPGGFGQNECPRWGSWDSVIGGCLQQMWDEGPGEPFSAHGHYINMSNARHSMVACGEGGGWFIQNFR